MDNICVVASLVLLGMFLITSPTEGFVRGYPLDLSDQRLQSSPWRRVTKQEIMDSEIKKEENREEAYEGGFLFRDPDNEDVLRSMIKKGDGNSDDMTVLAGNNSQPTGGKYPKARQNTSDYEVIVDTSNLIQSQDTTNGGKRAHGIDNNDNNINADNSASITIILPLRSKF